jgi:hypothetical protein
MISGSPARVKEASTLGAYPLGGECGPAALASLGKKSRFPRAGGSAQCICKNLERTESKGLKIYLLFEQNFGIVSLFIIELTGQI